MRLLVHACCGPCSLAPLQQLQQAGFEVALAFINPNIQPIDEYNMRKQTLCHLGERYGWQIFEADYITDEWERCVAPFALNNPRARCKHCYRVRLMQTAQLAVEHGFDAITTTLAVSPHQDHETLRQELERAAQTHGIKAYYRDFRDVFEEGQAQARDLNIYMQDSCGCRFSALEAVEDRAGQMRVRKAERQMIKALKKHGEVL